MQTDGDSGKYREIASAVGEARDRIDRHKNYLGDGPGAETRTRVFLIDPLLRSLGWDVLDPSRVLLEYRSGAAGRPDYVLQTSGTPRVIVEAKSRWNKQKTNALDQLYDYMDDPTLSKVSIGVLTDGDEWHICPRGGRSCRRR